MCQALRQVRFLPTVYFYFLHFYLGTVASTKPVLQSGRLLCTENPQGGHRSRKGMRAHEVPALDAPDVADPNFTLRPVPDPSNGTVL